MVFDGEPAYGAIDGAWLTGGDYVVLHRLAVANLPRSLLRKQSFGFVDTANLLFLAVRNICIVNGNFARIEHSLYNLKSVHAFRAVSKFCTRKVGEMLFSVDYIMICGANVFNADFRLSGSRTDTD